MKDVLAELFGKVPEQRLSALSGTAEELELLRERNRHIEVRYERLKLVTLGIWELLKERTGVSDDDLRAAIAQIDLSDGRRDGRLNQPEGMSACESCGRIVLMSSPRCPYCGNDNDQFDALRSV